MSVEARAENGKKGGRPRKPVTPPSRGTEGVLRAGVDPRTVQNLQRETMSRLTNDQFLTLFRLQDGHPCRCSYGNPTHTALYRRGLIAIRHIARRDYMITITASGLAAVQDAIALKSRQKSTLQG